MTTTRRSKAKGVDALSRLSRRERQIIEALYALGEATVAQVLGRLPDPPSEAAVRSALWLLEERGLVTHRSEGRANVYRAEIPAGAARASALKHLVTTFFGGSSVAATVALLGAKDDDLTDEELDHLASVLAKRRRRERSR